MIDPQCTLHFGGSAWCPPLFGMSIAEAPDGLLALPTITDCRWRLDVTVSTSALSRSFQPSVLMSLTFSDGQVRTFAVSVAQLHQLRYLLARSLRDLSLLEAKREKKK